MEFINFFYFLSNFNNEQYKVIENLFISTEIETIQKIMTLAIFK